MAEPKGFEFTYIEVVEALIKQQEIHEGIWGITMRFGIGATIGGPTQGQAVPTALVPVLNIGLTKVGKEGNTAVDAAKVNPAKPAKASKK